MIEISHECHGAWKAAILLGLCGVRGAAGAAVSGAGGAPRIGQQLGRQQSRDFAVFGQ
jgi:NhaP-type Na+/H+ or K+/H+ antiporter